MSILPTVIEVSIGAALIFLILSAICSSLAEMVSNLLDLRARYLQQGIIALLSDPAALKQFLSRPAAVGDFVGDVLRHPLLQKLDPAREGRTALQRLRPLVGAHEISLASRVPAELFSSVVLDQLRGRAPNYGARLMALRMRFKAMVATLSARGNSPVPPVMLEAVDLRDARQALEQIRQALPLIVDPQVRALVADLINAWDLEQIRQGVNSLPPSRAREVLSTFLDAAENETRQLERLQEQVANWFDSSMEQVSGWYKSHINWFLRGLALLVCLAFNADVVHIVDVLWRDPTVRQALIVQAEAAARAPAPAQAVLSDGHAVNAALSLDLQLREVTGLPIGWNCSQWNGIFREGYQLKRLTTPPAAEAGICGVVVRGTSDGQIEVLRVEGGTLSGSALALKLAGLLLMSLGVSLGANFWYQLLKQLLNLRGEKTG